MLKKVFIAKKSTLFLCDDQPQFVYFLTEHLSIIRPDKDFGLSKNL